MIAGYHWFTDWGRDTMISLEGLTLVTGRAAEAGYILRTFAHYIRDGLIPNMFPEGRTRRPLPHRRRVALVFPCGRSLPGVDPRPGEPLGRLAAAARDRRCTTSRAPGSASASIPATACCARASQGYQLTWMDAKVGDWVVTPRRGKAVEINALWYNALRLLEGWVRECRGQDDADANRVRPCRGDDRASFNDRFWYDAGGYLYDVVDGEQR